MKFKIMLRVASDKRGLELDEEYDRLEVVEEARDEPLGWTRGIDVDKKWAKRHPELFARTCTASVKVDSSEILPEDLEEWGWKCVVLKDLEYDRLDVLTKPTSGTRSAA